MWNVGDGANCKLNHCLITSELSEKVPVTNMCTKIVVSTISKIFKKYEWMFLVISGP